MPLELAFRLSVYLTLGAACACLGYAELAILPEIAVCIGLVGLLLGLAFWCDQREWHLSTRASNWLGGLICAGAVLWMGREVFSRPVVSGGSPWPSTVLPYLGPILMILVPAKLFRPKHVGDYWALQGIGLITVALGCALASDAIFGIFLVVYLLIGVWSLRLFDRYRSTHTINRVGNGHSLRTLAISSSLPWALAALATALVLFAATPRPTGKRWQMMIAPKQKLTVGYPFDRPGIDLSYSGALGDNSELVFEVQARDAAGQPKLDFAFESQRWRGLALNYYSNGRWDAMSFSILPGEREDGFDLPLFRPGNRPGEVRPKHTDPVLAPNQYTLTFTLHGRVGTSYFLAEPIAATNDGPFGPIVSLLDEDRVYRDWWRFEDGTLSPMRVLPIGQPGYRQTCLPVRGDVSPPVRLRSIQVERLCELPELPWVRVKTPELLEELAEQHLAPVEAAEISCLLSADLPLRPDHYERAARLLADYLRSKAYRYSLKLERQYPELDPVEDFLFFTRSGHCERFASGLAAMLRTVGIPCRVVLGFRGGERGAEPGQVLVRQHHAHAWVEILIPSAPPKDWGGIEDRRMGWWCWLSLDPTPAAEEEEPPSLLTAWWVAVQQALQDAFQSFIVEYDAGQQTRAREALLTKLRRGDVRAWLGVSVTLAVLTMAASFFVQRRRRSQAAAKKPLAFHDRLLAILARWQLRPTPNQTALEFADQTQPVLAERLAEPLPCVPLESARLFNRIRFGEQGLSAVEERAIQQRLDQLDQAIR